jgi:hypothetical protein
MRQNTKYDKSEFFVSLVNVLFITHMRDQVAILYICARRQIYMRHAIIYKTL